jgi:hypothetical protein
MRAFETRHPFTEERPNRTVEKLNDLRITDA